MKNKTLVALLVVGCLATTLLVAQILKPEARNAAAVAPGRYQLVQVTYNVLNPKNPGETRSSLFKIDSETGEVWIWVQGMVGSGWTEVWAKTAIQEAEIMTAPKRNPSR